MKRAVGYCEQQDCVSLGKGVFILDPDCTRFQCPQCRMSGQIEPEVGSYVGSQSHFRSVRVEHDFDPFSKTYRTIAIVTDNSLPVGNTFTLQSPLIKTEKRALRVAESLLGNLNLGYDVMSSSRAFTQEHILNFDAPFEKVVEELVRLQRSWANSGLANY